MKNYTPIIIKNGIVENTFSFTFDDKKKSEEYLLKLSQNLLPEQDFKNINEVYEYTFEMEKNEIIYEFIMNESEIYNSDSNLDELINKQHITTT